MKKEINKTLGNSLRCILPSFWWKRLLGKMVDKIDSAEQSAASASRIAMLAGSEAANKQERLVSGSNIKTICGKSILGSGDITPDPSMKVYIPMGGALDSYYQFRNEAFYRRVRDGGNWENSWRAIAVTASANNEVVLLGVSYNTTQGCRILISGFQEEDITDKYECVLLEDGSVSSVTKVEGESGGSSITIDSELSSTSENPLQNKVIYENLYGMCEEYTQMYEELGASVHEMSVDIYTKLLHKVDKVNGKQLSTEDFTSALKTKLEGLNNYDDTSIRNAVNTLTAQINTLVSGDASIAIESFNEIMAFLDGIKDTQSLAGIIASIEQQIAGKQDTISDLATIRSGAELGATAIQSVKTINGQSIVGSGNVVINADTSNLVTKKEFEDLINEILDNEEVVAAALNDVNERINAIGGNIAGDAVTKTEFEETIGTINESLEAKADKDYVDTSIAAAITNVLNTEV